VPAGIERMPFWIFLGLTTLGSLMWNAIFVVAGYFLGSNWHVVDEYAEIFQYIVIAAVVVALAVFVVKRVRERRNANV
jgi:membrane protein DedA with SNARE-associated domain